MYFRLFKLLITVCSSTIIFLLFENKSHVKTTYLIPILVGLKILYIFGDFEADHKYSLTDLLYWLFVLLVSLSIVKIKLTYFPEVYINNYIKFWNFHKLK